MYTQTQHFVFSTICVLQKILLTSLLLNIKTTCAQKTPIPLKKIEIIMSQRHKPVKLKKNTPSEDENYDDNNHVEIINESTQDQTSVEPKKPPTE